MFIKDLLWHKIVKLPGLVKCVVGRRLLHVMCSTPPSRWIHYMGRVSSWPWSHRA